MKNMILFYSIKNEYKTTSETPCCIKPLNNMATTLGLAGKPSICLEIHLCWNLLKYDSCSCLTVLLFFVFFMISKMEASTDVNRSPDSKLLYQSIFTLIHVSVNKHQIIINSAAII